MQACSAIDVNCPLALVLIGLDLCEQARNSFNATSDVTSEGSGKGLVRLGANRNDFNSDTSIE
eukprot:257826-Amphidinium_carterae.1